MKYLNHFLIWIAVFGFLETNSQVQLEKAAEYAPDPAISAERVEEIITLTQDALNNYATVGRLIDDKERRVTNASVKAFNDLFTPYAEIVKDYVEFPPRELVNVSDYSIEVYNLLSDKGVEFMITRAEIQEIRVRKLGNSTFYIPVVVIDKVVYTYLDRLGILKQSTSGKTIELKVSFDIFSEDLSEASIAKIEHGVDVKPADDYNRLISIYALGGTAAYNTTLSPYWEEAHSKNTLSVTGNINWGLGVDFGTDQFITSKGVSNRNIGWTAGLRFTSMNIDVTASEFSTPIDPQTVSIGQDQIAAERLISTGNIKQSITVNSLSVPLGFDYKVIKTRTMIFALHARVVPILTLSGGGTLSGTLLHDIRIPDADLQLSNPNSGMEAWGNQIDAGSRTFEQDFQPELQPFLIGFEFSPTVYFNFEDANAGWGILVGADIGFVPTTFLVHDPIESTSEESLTLSSEVNPLMSSYITDFNALQFGLRVGLFHRNVTQP